MKYGLRWMLFGCLLFLWTTTLHAEIYRYVDPSGTVRFTDNLLDVPEAQRKNILVLPETTAPATTDQAFSLPQKSETKHPPTSLKTLPKSKGAQSSPPDILEEAERLNKERADLDQEYLELVREQSALTDQRPNVRDVEAMNRYNEQVTALNQRTDAYEARRQAFQQKVDAFNERLRRHLDRSIEPSSGKAGPS